MFWFASHLQDLDSSLQSLTTQFEKATAEKISCQEEVASTNQTIELANRLVKGLEVSREGPQALLVPFGPDWQKLNCQFIPEAHKGKRESQRRVCTVE